MSRPNTTPLPSLFRVDDRPGFHARGILWAMIAPHEAQAQRNHYQTLRRLHARGGLSWCEALAVLEDRPWREDPDAKQKVQALVAQWERQNGRE